MSLDSQAIHSLLGAEGWRRVLLSAGVGEKQLANKHGPCPACGGKDRFRFDNKRGRGDFICNHCGAGDGFKLLMNIQGVDFAQARKTAIDLGGLQEDEGRNERVEIKRPQPIVQERAKPTGRALALLRESCALEDCEPAMRYLRRRGLWPLPEGHRLKAHTSVPYWQDREQIGRYPALIAAVRDTAGELVTLHVTYLEPSGESKLQGFESRKLLSGLSGREGCAVPLLPPDGGVLGIAEGIETAFAASVLHAIPVWAALNSALMAKFIPPSHVHSLAIFADRDVAGLLSTGDLMERLQGKVRLSIHTPNNGDWNDYLLKKLGAM